MASKQIDRWLKSEIEKVPERIIKFRDNSKENKMTTTTISVCAIVLIFSFIRHQHSFSLQCIENR